jgi:predicted transglutaminase-like cysteine proteinase
MNIRCIIAAAMLALFATAPVFASGFTDRAHISAGSWLRAPMGWRQFCKQTPDDCVAKPSAITTVTLTPERWQELDVVNRFFNKTIEPMTDLEQYGVVERWTYATSGKGDCEDYVLEKRRRLIELGWPVSALPITVVYDRNNSGHAVLTVVSDQGDYVLDNVRDDIVVWWDTGLTFLERQSAGDPNIWVDLGRTIGKPELLTATSRR